MSEKEDLLKSDDNIISTSTNKDEGLGISNDLNSPLIPDNEKVNGSQNNIFKVNTSFLCKKPSDLNIIYRGKIDNELLQKEKNNSEYFVIKPSFTVYNLPKRLKAKLGDATEEKVNELKSIYDQMIKLRKQNLEGYKKIENSN